MSMHHFVKNVETKGDLMDIVTQERDREIEELTRKLLIRITNFAYKRSKEDPQLFISNIYSVTLSVIESISGQTAKIVGDSLNKTINEHKKKKK